MDIRSARRRRGRAQRIERRIKRMTEELNLTEEQQKEIRKILSERGKQKDIRKKINRILTKEQKEKQKEIDKKLINRRKNR